MGNGLIVTLVILGVLVVGFLWIMGSYNGLVALGQGVKTARAQIDVMLKRRYDLIPNLVETVKGYATHEKSTLEAVVSARNAAVSASSSGSVGQSAQAEGQLSGAVRQLFAVAEAYPDLKANTNFLQLQGELAGTENQIASQSQQFNDVVRSYNTRLMSFPVNLIAGSFGFRPEQYFEIANPTEREAPKVKF